MRKFAIPSWFRSTIWLAYQGSDQWLLLTLSAVRKLAIPSWFRSLIWLAYLGSDALAIYAMATLFSRQMKQDHGSVHSNSILEVVWAPVLLMHLGGQDGITAYNIEDNELWTRHVLTAITQITVAIYVFCKSWPGDDKRLLQASILLFVPGILKCLEKPWALKSASFNSLASSSEPYRHLKRMACPYALFQKMTQMLADKQPMAMLQARKFIDVAFPEWVSPSALRLMISSKTGKDITLEDYVREARDYVLGNGHPQARGRGATIDLEHNQTPQVQGEDDTAEPNLVPEARVLSDEEKRRIRKKILGAEARKLFVDLASSYRDRLSILETFLVHDANMAYESLQEGLYETFGLLYTKAKMAHITEVSLMQKISNNIREATMYLSFAAIGLFHKSHREAYNINDVKVTYALLCCTAVLELFSQFADRIKLTSSGMVAQYSLVGFFARNKRHSKKMHILSSFKCKDFLDQRWCMESCPSSSRITELVLGHVKGWWKEHIVDAASYRRFNDHRGQWTIQHTGCYQDLAWSANKPFDESVLLWHIATDMCFFQNGVQSVSQEKATGCREISNYMMYLLFVNPEMLLPGTRRNLFLEANAELEEILEDDKASLKAILNGEKPSLMEILKGNKPFPQFLKEKGPSPEEIERGFMGRIIAKLESLKCRETDPGCIESPTVEEQCPAQEGFIQDAWKISEVLLALDDKKMWEVIEGVWVEMLCFSASRCRGFLHAKSMGTGIELLTYVWFLLSRMGMETLPERLQRTELSSGEGYAGTTPSTSQIYGIQYPTRFRRSKPHEEAAADAAGASTSHPQEILQAD
uniref:DUF4220 domain-containing protein n=1 Tax=Aegilops tauschii TaxID=37682 RepID=R7W706_AEGTA